MSFAVSVEHLPADGAFQAKFQAPDAELNVWFSADEIPLLRQVGDAIWNDRTTIRIGASAGSPAFWSCTDGRLTILVGHDDETWDFALSMPMAILDDLVAAVALPQK